METIVMEGIDSFKDLEEKIYQFCCEYGREITRVFLESYDKELHDGRDTRKYRDKGKRATSIKTIYGTVEYSRYVYLTKLEDGANATVYLLDEAMGMEKIGLISTNLAEKIAIAATEEPYRKCAESICRTTGENISHMCAWNLIQKLGERISEEENLAVERMKAGTAEGKKEIPLLFEEMDGVWLRMQDSHHKKIPGKEMKVFTAYEGWDEEKEKAGRSTLLNKKTLAGMEGSEEFHNKREACIEDIYNVDEIGQRVLNGDGGAWIREPFDEDTVFQLDPYHVQAAILKGIRDEEARASVRELLQNGKINEMLEYIKVYADSVSSDDPGDRRSKSAMDLLSYLENNKNGLLPWQKQVKEIPVPPEGCVYKNMGIEENQNCTVITLRMKNRRMRWSEEGANNMGKNLYRKENGELQDTIGRYAEEFVQPVKLEEVLEPLSAAKAPKKDGKGNPYVDILGVHVPVLDAVVTAGRKFFAGLVQGAAL